MSNEKKIKVRSRFTFKMEIDGDLFYRGETYEIGENTLEKWKNYFDVYPRQGEEVKPNE